MKESELVLLSLALLPSGSSMTPEENSGSQGLRRGVCIKMEAVKVVNERETWAPMMLGEHGDQEEG